MRVRIGNGAWRGLATVVVLVAAAGCGPEGYVGAGAVVGIAAYQERGVDGVARDLRIGLDIRERWFRHDHTLPAKVGLSVYEGRALLTGTVDDPQVGADAVRLARTAPGVLEVIDEIRLADTDLLDTARDRMITTELKVRITVDEDIDAVNYAITTVDNVIYLMGIAQDRKEMEKVIAHARDIAYVRHIVNHVRVKPQFVDRPVAGVAP